MTNHDIDLVVMAGSAAGLTGMWLGYVLRGLRERVRRHHDEMRSINQYKPYVRKVKENGGRPLSAPQVAYPQADRPKFKVVPNIDPMREDVIAALTSSGYKKAQATAAVDACLRGECTSVEAWTVAALRKAGGR